MDIQTILEENSAGFRKVSETMLKNEWTGEVIYTPPQHPNDILNLMQNLVQFMNDETLSDWDALVKMAIIHHKYKIKKENYYINNALFELLANH